MPVVATEPRINAKQNLLYSHNACTPGWKHRLGLRSVNRPVFEGAWNCSPTCLLPRITSAIKREAGDGCGVSRQYQHRLPLGLLLLQQGTITQEELQIVLQAQRTAGHGRFGDWLRIILHMDESTIARSLARQWSCPIFGITDLQPARMALLAPAQLLHASEAVPLRISLEGRIHLAFRESLDASLAIAIERMAGIRLDKGLAMAHDFEEARERIEEADAIPVTEHRVDNTPALEDILVRSIMHSQPVASRFVRVHSTFWLRMWLEEATLNNGIAGPPHSPIDIQDVLIHFDPPAQ
ncbi:MAG: hypothetical protein JSS87_13465 [Acidobacteria bacterium]|nr:hypothetical protein [Acidobacteriota bacterium]